MARHYYGVDIGDSIVDESLVEVDVNSTGDDVEISTLDGAGLTKIEVLKAIEKLETYFQKPNNTITA